MTARTTMADLITRIRFLVGDPETAGTPPTSRFTDDEIQDALDRHSIDVVQSELIARPVYTAGDVEWHNYSARFRDWEDDPTIEDSEWNVLDPDVSDCQAGRWTFTASQEPPVFITGRAYDVYASAVDVLRAWHAKAAAEFDFATDGQSFSRSQKATQIAALAAEYQRRVLGGIRMVPRD